MAKPRVVIFEDEPLIALDVQEALEEAGCTVCGVFKDSTAAEAISAEIQPDMVIVDLNLMDGPTGVDLARHFHDRGCEVIVFSGHCGIDPKLCQFSHTFISKPLSPELLAQALRPAA